MILSVNPFAPGELYDWMWGCCSGTHAGGGWHDNGNDLYAPPGARCVAPIAGTVIRAGVPAKGQGQRVGIQGSTHSVYMAHMTGLLVREGQQVVVGQPVGEIWDFPGVPSHLHFSIARGSYDAGAFVDPKLELARTAVYVAGRTYRVQRIVNPPSEPLAYYLEEVPWVPAKGTGYGPRVLGPWSSRRVRDGQMRPGPDVGVFVPYDDKVHERYYILHMRERMERWGYGPWADADSRKKARRALQARLGRTLRPFAGVANSLYPTLEV